MTQLRSVSVYFRDENKVMRRIPNVKALVVKGVATKVYTLPPGILQEMDL